MKKIFALLILFSLFSCREESPRGVVTLTEEEYTNLINDNKDYPRPFTLSADYEQIPLDESGIILASDGHEYLITNRNRNSENVEHYVDCKLCQERAYNEQNKSTQQVRIADTIK